MGALGSQNFGWLGHLRESFDLWATRGEAGLEHWADGPPSRSSSGVPSPDCFLNCTAGPDPTGWAVVFPISGPWDTSPSQDLRPGHRAEHWPLRFSQSSLYSAHRPQLQTPENKKSKQETEWEQV